MNERTTTRTARMDARLDEMMLWSTEYMNGISNLQQSRLYWWNQSVNPTAYEEFVYSGALVATTLTPALLIFHEWQKDYTKAWKWNQSHRHISEEARVSWSDNRSFPERPVVIPRFHLTKKQKLDVLFEVGRDWNKVREAEKVAFWKIKSTFNRKWDAEIARERKKRIWWSMYVTPRYHSNDWYWLFRRDFYGDDEGTLVNKKDFKPDAFVKKCMEFGLTFRNARRTGYLPYVREAIQLQASFENELFHISRFDMDPGIVRSGFWGAFDSGLYGAF